MGQSFDSLSRRTLRLGGYRPLLGVLSLPALKPAHVRQLAFHVPPFCNQLGHDRYGNFFRSNRANVEPNGRMYALE